MLRFSFSCARVCKESNAGESGVPGKADATRAAVSTHCGLIKEPRREKAATRNARGESQVMTLCCLPARYPSAMAYRFCLSVLPDTTYAVPSSTSNG